MSGRDESGFLGRWSERKLKARSEPEAVPTPATEEAPPAVPAEAGEKTEAEMLEELGLPDPDTMGKGDDFSGFMQAAVPAALRSRALRRLWLSDPVLANVDGLVEYGNDFTDAATVVPNLQTAYKVGRGMLRDEPAPEPDAAEQDGPEGSAERSAEAGEVAEDGPAAPGGEPPGEEAVASADEARGGGAAAPDEPGRRADGAGEGVTAPRRMRFSFDEG